MEKLYHCSRLYHGSRRDSITAAQETLSWQQERLYHGGRLHHGVEVEEITAGLYHRGKRDYHSRSKKSIIAADSIVEWKEERAPARLYHGGLRDSIMAGEKALT